MLKAPNMNCQNCDQPLLMRDISDMELGLYECSRCKHNGNLNNLFRESYKTQLGTWLNSLIDELKIEVKNLTPEAKKKLTNQFDLHLAVKAPEDLGLIVRLYNREAQLIMAANGQVQNIDEFKKDIKNKQKL